MCQVLYTVAWLCRLLNKTDWFTQAKAAKALTAILEARPDKEPFVLADGAPNEALVSQGVDHAMKTFIEWLCSQLRYTACDSTPIQYADCFVHSVIAEQLARIELQGI